MRKSMKFTYTKGRQFIKKDIQVDKNDNPKMVQVLLFNAERLWAYAMDLKQKLTNDTQMKENRRLKFHIRRKLAKAIKWAKILAQITQKQAEQKSALEAEAYAEYLTGLYNFEIEHWDNSLVNSAKALEIYKELIKISDTLDQIVFKEKIEQLEQQIRYCNHKLQKGIKEFTVEQILKEANAINDPALKQKFSALFEEHIKESVQNQGGVYISYHNEQYPLKNDKVVMLYQKITDTEKVVKNQQIQKDNPDQSAIQGEEKLQLFVELFSYYDESIRLIQKEKDEFKDQESLQKAYQQILNYFQAEKYKTLLSRNKLLLLLAQLRLQFKQKQLKGVSTKQTIQNFELVRYIDNILHVYKQLLELEKSNPEFLLIQQ
eukprot:TRINITY_DN8839_c0_g1_i15.p1 TRINITY_DN8839_c0_g1~~TRINITY_DN8839_c0_g1_i15.p1  ORF type:complete len:375 (+),score=68.00 TRINITY_DN8839_c0_g1_i15:167-1291(+)